jgi:Na+/proline symporter
MMMILLVAAGYLLLIYGLLMLAGRKNKTERPAPRQVESGS